MIMLPRSILLLGLLATMPASAQLLTQTALDSTREYYSIESAMKEPEKVYRLQLTKKKLREVPPEIRQMKNLNALDLGRNKLAELPDWMDELVYMQEFRAGQNKFSEMPAVVCKWPHLKRLDLHQNEITGFLPCMGDLKELFSLDLWSNDLGEFPEEIRGMEALRFMDLRVIQFDQKEMEHIAELLPKVKIFFSQPCNCGVGE